ncbi:DegV family EDD domain-containing protein [candidate division WOR-3 bacterium]|uniref:DegV family EDD domain-containing protein n=1 Tax=candidate division WOR-3 bacterium TaxID=2052148 RepID=A0A9D5QC27_UNCW3|nr:DegV family EDD domain-containing protein [candidate division WOR-3 bacterium]MBD3364228.1 DegV family EDD domain-containing protein [candidate division WOR-3 bacterium]
MSVWKEGCRSYSHRPSFIYIKSGIQIRQYNRVQDRGPFGGRGVSVGIVTDDASNIPRDLTKELDIEVVEYPVWFPDEDINIETPEEIYKQMREKEMTAKTSAPPPVRFKRAYQKQLAKYDHVLVILLYKEFSGTYDSAENAWDRLDDTSRNRVTLFDSTLASVAEGLVVLKAHELTKTDMGPADIVSNLEEFKLSVKLFAFIEDLKWLIKGGRLREPWAGPALALQKAGVRPAIGIANGQVKMTGLKVTGKDYIKAMLKELSRLSRKKPLTAAVAHAGLPQESLMRLKQGIKGMDVELLFTAQLTPLIGSHTGPGTIMVAYNY